MSVRRSSRFAAKDLVLNKPAADARMAYISLLVREVMAPILNAPAVPNSTTPESTTTVRFSKRLAAKPRKTYKEIFEPKSKPLTSVNPPVVKEPWNTERVQLSGTLSTFPTYGQLFRKYNFPASLLPTQCLKAGPDLYFFTLDTKVVEHGLGTDYGDAVSGYCNLMRQHKHATQNTLVSMLTAYGLKDCAKHMQDNSYPSEPTYDYKHRQILFEPVHPFETVAYHAPPPEYIPAVVRTQRLACVSALRKLSFVQITRTYLNMTDVIVANKGKYASEEEYLEAKIENSKQLYLRLMEMQDVLACDGSLRTFALTTEFKAFELMDQIAEHTEVCPIKASETLYVLRSFIVIIRALLTALEDSE